MEGKVELRKKWAVNLAGEFDFVESLCGKQKRTEEFFGSHK